jgi:hypothetical protein
MTGQPTYAAALHAFLDDSVDLLVEDRPAACLVAADRPQTELESVRRLLLLRGLVFDEIGENADMEMYSHVLVDMSRCTDIRSLLRSARSRSVTVILLGTPASAAEVRP